ncbi:MAG: geopeptide radical SAM maturase [Nitrospirae bacterium]|nr:geopeptide radical SAM maturase [Nitrospirota bacterium]
MELSRYLKVYTYSEKTGYLLLFSTKKSSKILLKEETFNSILKGNFSPENEAVLLKLGMIVPDTEAEKREVHGMLDSINEKNRTLNVSVIINLDCNFNCVYCYEGDMKGKHYMTDETAGLLVDFIKSNFTPNKKKINIDFYGGEPLLSLELIKEISGEMKSFAEGRGAVYSCHLVSNGSLFKMRIAQELAGLGLTGVKITLDGPPEVHNAFRPFRSGAGSFEGIIENIRQTCDIVNIQIGGNYTQDNHRKFPLLFGHLEKAGLTPDKISEVNFYPVMKNPSDINSHVDFNDGFMSLNEPWVIQAGALLREEILRRGYNSLKVTPSPCQMDITDFYVVNNDGGIYKCQSFIGRKNFEIGNLRDGVADYKASLKLGIWKNGECKDCEYLPLCFGGCRYMTYVRDGNISKVDCKKPHLDSVLETFIKQDIKYKVLNH